MARMPDGLVIVDLPLRGDGWVAVTSPGDRIPSHGTDMLGQRFAFDFLKVDGRKSLHVHPASTARALLMGVPTNECYAYGQPVYAPLDGEVVTAVDGRAERSRVNPIVDSGRALWTGMTFRPERLPEILGNYVIVRGSSEIYAAFAHLAPGSVAVARGQAVRRGDVIGRVGHTGNSTSPHLHFQLMDSADPLQARGIACGFREYEVRAGDGWRHVVNGVPQRNERLRT